MDGARAEGPVAALVVATTPRAGRCRPGLEPLLGAEGCARLERVLVSRAAAWAADIGDAYVAFAPGDVEEELAALAPGATLLSQEEGDVGERLAAATGEVLDRHGGPVLAVGVDTPRLSRSHGEAALDDLRHGIDVTFGPGDRGGYYLVGLSEPHPELFALPSECWGGPEVLRLSFEAAARAGLSLGMLRSERELADAGDAEAFLADPLTPPDVREALLPPVSRALR